MSEAESSKIRWGYINSIDAVWVYLFMLFAMLTLVGIIDQIWDNAGVSSAVIYLSVFGGSTIGCLVASIYTFVRYRKSLHH